jgi:5-methylcytosine-specific restriction endonuclease McrA
MRDVLVLNATYEPLAVCDARRAVLLLLDDKADLVAPDGAARLVRSPSIQVPLPAVVRLRQMVRLPRGAGVPLSRQAVLLRDRYECAYCSDAWADTIDHVVPRSRGGRHEWRNVVAACRPCNHRKGDRLLAELGWRLRYQPIEPRGSQRLAVPGAAPEWVPYLPAAA